jgi:hypothetical protein
MVRGPIMRPNLSTQASPGWGSIEEEEEEEENVSMGNVKRAIHFKFH